MYCKNCGSEVNQNDKFCPSCGCQITEEVSPVNGDPIDSKSEVNKKSSGLKKSSKIIIAPQFLQIPLYFLNTALS